MSAFKGTKGKWIANPKYQTIEDEKGHSVCQEMGIINTDNWKYNSKLISFAPEMLEMLERVYPLLKERHLYETANNIKELIKKATEL